jgi:hypothetical protein
VNWNFLPGHPLRMQLRLAVAGAGEVQGSLLLWARRELSLNEIAISAVCGTPEPQLLLDRQLFPLRRPFRPGEAVEQQFRLRWDAQASACRAELLVQVQIRRRGRLRMLVLLQAVPPAA